LIAADASFVISLDVPLNGEVVSLEELKRVSDGKFMQSYGQLALYEVQTDTTNLFLKVSDFSF